MLKKRLLLTAMTVLMIMSGRASAENTIKIGAIYPLTGGTASAGTALRDAVEVAADILNNPRPELSVLAFSPAGGLPGLGGRKIEVIFADNQGNPATSQNQALRLITQEKIVALVGTYTSSTTLTASATAERNGIPFIAGEASAPSLTLRGFKWFFRPTPIGTDFGAAYADFLVGLKAKGRQINTVAMVNENTEYGISTGDAISKSIEAQGLKIAPRIVYSANSTDVSAQVLQLKQANPDAVIFVSYTSDSILFMKTMRNLDWKPPVLIGDDSGFSDTAFISAVGDLAEGAVNRSSYDIGKPGSVTYALNEVYKKKTGHNLDDTSARGLQGFLVMCDAINRAGSTEPAKIQAALQATDMGPERLMIGYNGVKFDANGQNEKAATLLVQLRNGEYLPIWPDKLATTQPALPFKGWTP